MNCSYLHVSHSVQQSLCLLQGCVNDQRPIQSAERDTYQSYDVENRRCTIWQPSRAAVVHCEVCQGLEEDQVQKNEDEKGFAGRKQLL